MKLTLEHTEYEDGRKIVVEEFNDEQDVFEALQMVFDALVGFGYHPDSVKDGFVEFAQQFEEEK